MWIARRWPHVGLLVLTSSVLWMAPAVSTAQRTPAPEEPAAPADEETPSTVLDAQETPLTDEEDLSTELAAPQRLLPPPPPDATAPHKPPVERWTKGAAVFAATSSTGALCGTAGLLAAAGVALPLAVTCCGVATGLSVVGVWCYTACICAVPTQAVASVVLALVMPFAAMMGAWATGLQNTVSMGLLKVWGLSAAASITALVLGLLGMALLVGVGSTAGFAALNSGGLGAPLAVYSTWLVFAAALAAASVFPVALAVLAQAVTALLTMALVVWEQTP